MTALLTFDRIHAAHEILATRLLPTPLIAFTEEKLLGDVWLKCECLQPTGSFKIRGATFRISQLSREQKAAGVIAYSTGNHAQAVAKAAADANISAVIVMSPDASDHKILGTKRWGAEIIMAAPSSTSRRTLSESMATQTGATLIPPYIDFDVMAGQGSIACELQSQLASLKDSTHYVPVGGGGLLAGVATAAKAIDAACRVIGVEPELENDAARSFARGSIVMSEGPSASIADAIKVQALGELTFPREPLHRSSRMTDTACRDQ